MLDAKGGTYELGGSLFPHFMYIYLWLVFSITTQERHLYIRLDTMPILKLSTDDNNIYRWKKGFEQKEL